MNKTKESRLSYHNLMISFFTLNLNSFAVSPCYCFPPAIVNFFLQSESLGAGRKSKSMESLDNISGPRLDQVPSLLLSLIIANCKPLHCFLPASFQIV